MHHDDDSKFASIVYLFVRMYVRNQDSRGKKSII